MGTSEKVPIFAQIVLRKGITDLRPPFVSFADISPAGGIFLSRSPHASPNGLHRVCLHIKTPGFPAGSFGYGGDQAQGFSVG